MSSEPIIERSMSTQDGLWARTGNLLIAGWLFLSAFLWDHAAAERVNAAYVGALAFAAALVAVPIPRARHVTSVLALWLFISVILLPSSHEATGWNNALVAIAMFGLSLVAPRSARRPPTFFVRQAARARATAGKAA